MSMTACKECGKPVAKSAESCPHCGAFRHRQAQRRTSPVTWLVAGIIGIPLAIAIVIGFMHST